MKLQSTYTVPREMQVSHAAIADHLRTEIARGILEYATIKVAIHPDKSHVTYTATLEIVPDVNEPV